MLPPFWELREPKEVSHLAAGLTCGALREGALHSTEIGSVRLSASENSCTLLSCMHAGPGMLVGMRSGPVDIITFPRDIKST